MLSVLLNKTYKIMLILLEAVHNIPIVFFPHRYKIPTHLHGMLLKKFLLSLLWSNVYLLPSIHTEVAKTFQELQKSRPPLQGKHLNLR